MSKKMPPQITAEDLRRLILDHHQIGKKRSRGVGSQESWAVFFELRNGTGYGRTDRYLDAFAMNLWESKKFWRVAYEFKVSRTDFLAELKKPEKRSWGMSISNEFYFVTPPEVIKPTEVPEGCGLMVVHGQKLKRVVVAKQREAADFTMSEMAAIARQVQNQFDYSAFKVRYNGCELDEEALDMLVQQRLDDEIQSRIVQWAKTKIEGKMQSLTNALTWTREELIKAGLQPMPWLEEIEKVLPCPHAVHFEGGRPGSIRKWVQENVYPGPTVPELTAALNQHGDVQKSMVFLRQRLEKALGEVDQLVSRSQQALKTALDRAEQPDAETTSPSDNPHVVDSAL